MDLVLITKRRGTLLRFKLRPAVWCLVAFGFGAFGFGFTSLGYAVAERQLATDFESEVDDSTDRYAALVQTHRENVTALKQASEDSLTALTARLGRLQAEVTRLNALAGQVAEAAGLDVEEFMFEEPAAVGGLEGDSATVPSWSEAVADLDQVAKAFELERYRLEAFSDLLISEALSERTMPSGRPLLEGWISSGYGYRTDPISGRRSFHDGIDFAGKRNAQVLSVAAGVVTWSGPQSGYGTVVEVTHGNGYVTRYAHNRENLVEVGEQVEQGQAIALLGSTGRSTGPHVHFEVMHAGKTVNPWKFIQAQRVADAGAVAAPSAQTSTDTQP